MRSWFAVIALLVLLPSASANHAVYLDKATVMGCLLQANPPGILVALNCQPVTDSAPAAEASGGSYRLTVDWAAANAEWGQLRAELRSCAGTCEPAGSGVCINNNCVGNPQPGNQLQFAQTQGASPLVVEIPTAGAETFVSLAIQVVGTAKVLAGTQGIHYVLEHVG